MSGIKKPMLASEVELASLRYPVLGSPKLDGIRALVVGGKLLSRSFKSIPNEHIRKQLEGKLPDGIDGELLVGETFQTSSSGIMSRSGEPEFKYAVFDQVTDPSRPFHLRLSDAGRVVSLLGDPRVVLVPHSLIHNEKDLMDMYSAYLAQGYEGLMVRDPNGPYKYGRASAREGWLLKVKPWLDSEARVTGYVEQMHNDNPAEEDAFGRTKRAQKLEHLVPAGTLGALLGIDIHSGLEVKIGSGFDAKTRDELWATRAAVVGKIVKYKYQPTGVLVKPRFPIFLGFRSEEDL